MIYHNVDPSAHDAAIAASYSWHGFRRLHGREPGQKLGHATVTLALGEVSRIGDSPRNR